VWLPPLKESQKSMKTLSCNILNIELNAVILCTRFKTNNYLSPQFMEYKKDHDICR
jgi:hypothetical protein